MSTRAIQPLPDEVQPVTLPRVVSPSGVVSPQANHHIASLSGDDPPASTSMLARVVSMDPEIRTLARSIAQAAVEVLAGTRPAQQLSRSLEPTCLTALQHRAALTRAHGGSSQTGRPRLHRNPLVRSVRVCAVKDDVYEASLVVSEELRSRAVAMRLERSNGTWKVTALEIG